MDGPKRYDGQTLVGRLQIRTPIVGGIMVGYNKNHIDIVARRFLQLFPPIVSRWMDR